MHQSTSSPTTTRKIEDSFSTSAGSNHISASELVDAVSGTDYKLRIAGTGSVEEDLRRRADDDVEFLGFVSEDRKRDLLARCDALLFNSEHEDFGIVPVEAFASGKPVIGVNEGFTKYQIEEDVNGILFDRGVKNVRDAINKMYGQMWDAEKIQATAERYGMERFEREWCRLIYQEDSEPDAP
ncbi:glycosyltransferase [Halospeciosus flavus]|uniref:glycosyltransferase n=1 Tax=Halospeciosus flavus TaxID=3032283 RepID=UPI003610447F